MSAIKMTAKLLSTIMTKKICHLPLWQQYHVRYQYDGKILSLPIPIWRQNTVITNRTTKLWLCWGLTSQSTIFQSCWDGAIASWVINQYFRGVKCLAQGHNTATVGFELRTSRSRVRHSTTEPPRSPYKIMSASNMTAELCHLPIWQQNYIIYQCDRKKHVSYRYNSITI